MTGQQPILANLVTITILKVRKMEATLSVGTEALDGTAPKEAAKSPLTIVHFHIEGFSNAKSQRSVKCTQSNKCDILY